MPKEYGTVLKRTPCPNIRTHPINQITPPELLDCLRKVKKRGALEIASKTKQV